MAIFRPKKALKILFVGTEAAPFVKIGGLGSVMYSLPKALKELGHDARVMIPRYLSIDNSIFNLKLEHRGLTVPTDSQTGPSELVCNVKRHDPTKETDTVTTYFLENQEYYEQRANVYGYADDTARWSLLCRGTLEFLRVNKDWQPDVIVSSDWQSGLIPNLLKTKFKNDRVLSRISSVFSIHNLYFQAMFDHKFVPEAERDNGHTPVPGLHDADLSKINWMRRGIMHADVINTVSPNYAREIMTKDYGEMLDDLLRERRSVISGILNGIDYTLWNPEKNASVPYKFSADKIDNRAPNKKFLQERFGLEISDEKFLMCFAGRLSKQKGLDILFPIIDRILEELPIQLIIVGDGESDMMGFFHDLASRHRGKVATHLKFDAVLPHMVFAGADALIMPSRFEPCGLAQMEAMHMGAVPIVRKTGGLTDSVEDYNPEKGTGNGFVFERFDSTSFMITLIRAFENFRDKKKWRALQIRAMKQDFSWKASAEQYVALFTRAIEIHNNY
jgi:starch synthase